MTLLSSGGRKKKTRENNLKWILAKIKRDSLIGKEAYAACQDLRIPIFVRFGAHTE